MMRDEQFQFKLPRGSKLIDLSGKLLMTVVTAAALGAVRTQKTVDFCCRSKKVAEGQFDAVKISEIKTCRL